MSEMNRRGFFGLISAAFTLGALPAKPTPPIFVVPKLTPEQIAKLRKDWERLYCGPGMRMTINECREIYGATS